MRQDNKSERVVEKMCDVEPIYRFRVDVVGAAFRYPSAYAVGFWKTSPRRGCDVMQLVQYFPDYLHSFARGPQESAVIAYETGA